MKPQCVQERPVSESLPDGRRVACHFWREIQNAGGGAPLAARVSTKLTERVSTKLTERLALYRERQTAQAAATVTAE
jgi:peptide/nickel transport system ATP-binding protein